jgi:hypothetical protein
VHQTRGSLRDFRVFFWLQVFSTSQAATPPTHTLVTQTVGWLTPKSKSKTVFESQVSFFVCLKKQIHLLGLVKSF